MIEETHSRGHYLAKFGWGIAMAAAIVVLAFLLGNILVPVVVAFFTAYILDPVIDRFESRGFNRTFGIVVFLSLMAVFLTAFVIILIPVVQTQTQDFTRNFPQYIHRMQNFIVTTALPGVEEMYGKPLPTDYAQLMETLPKSLATVWPELIQYAQKTLRAVMLNISWLAAGFVSMILIPVFTFYFLRDFDRIRFAVMELFPRPTFEYWVGYFKEIDTALASVIRGQLTVCAVLGILYAIGLSIIGLPLGALVGLLTGALAFIPYVGFSVGFLIALILALFAWNGPALIIGVLVVYGAVQLFDAIAITPRILGGKLQVSPVVIIIGLFVGGRLFGFIGVLLAVPVMAILKVALRHIIISYRKSAYYLGAEQVVTADMVLESIAMDTSRGGSSKVPPPDDGNPPAASRAAQTDDPVDLPDDDEELKLI